MWRRHKRNISYNSVLISVIIIIKKYICNMIHGEKKNVLETKCVARVCVNVLVSKLL